MQMTITCLKLLLLAKAKNQRHKKWDKTDEDEISFQILIKEEIVDSVTKAADLQRTRKMK